MLSWDHENRATAQEMLKHPWLNMSDNYEFKYTDIEYDKMITKKGMKNTLRGGKDNTQDNEVQDDRQEMNELIESD
jgi:hypothetical protein